MIVRLDLNSDKLGLPRRRLTAPAALPRREPGAGAGPQAKTSGDAVLEIKVNSPTGLLALGESQLTVRATSLSGNRGGDCRRRAGHPDAVVGSELVVSTSLQSRAGKK